jgi:hypothetical protein
VDYADGGLEPKTCPPNEWKNAKASAHVRHNKLLKQRVSVPTASTFQHFNVLAPHRLLQLQRRIVQFGAIKFLILR